MIEKILQWIVKLTKTICGIMIGILVVLNFGAVIMRRAFSKPIMWCEEVSLLLFVWTISLILISMTYYRRAVKLDFFIDMMPSMLQHAFSIAVKLISAISLAIVALLGISLMKKSGYRFTAILQIPYSYVYLSMVIGMGTSAFIYAYDGMKEFCKLFRKEG